MAKRFRANGPFHISLGQRPRFVNQNENEGQRPAPNDC